MKNRSLEEWRQFLKEDFLRVTGLECQHFFCPILLRDEDVPLCLGHVVNQAFGLESEKRVAQRADVDNFYGMAFEADFLDIEKIADLRKGIIQPVDLFSDKDTERRFNLKVIQDDKHIRHAYLGNHKPANFLPVTPISEKQKTGFGFLLNEGIEVKGQNIECELELKRDVYVEGIASLIKAAHLTLFYILGYKYACNPSGLFLSSILGWFFNQHKDKKQREIGQEAREYFPDFANMIRPIINFDTCDLGTVVNGRFICCYDHAGRLWAVIVRIRTKSLMHAVLVPMMDTQYHLDMFFALMHQTQTVEITAKYAEFAIDTNEILIEDNIFTLLWTGNS
jgi:hypothetical protein